MIDIREIEMKISDCRKLGKPVSELVKELKNLKEKEAKLKGKTK